jgi:monofunctional biosynthetic peptidoglycan transglycosylase
MSRKSRPAAVSKARKPAPARAPKARIGRARVFALGLLVLGLGLLVHAFATLPDADEVSRLARRPPRSTALIDARAREAAEQGQRFEKRQRWVPLGEIAPELVACVLSSEDARFFDHDGVDARQLRDALQADLRAHRFARGASTLTQQLAKNLWLSERKSPLRKLQELVLARRLEQALTKERILELYLNEVEWGDGVFGVGAAARVHFGKDARTLTLAESAVLAAMLPAPRRLGPGSDAAELWTRARRVLERVADEHLAAPASIALAREELERLRASRPRA